MVYGTVVTLNCLWGSHRVGSLKGHSKDLEFASPTWGSHVSQGMRCIVRIRTAGSSEAKSLPKPKWFNPFFFFKLWAWPKFHLNCSEMLFFFFYLTLCSHISRQKSGVQTVLFGRAGINKNERKAEGLH